MGDVAETQRTMRMRASRGKRSTIHFVHVGHDEQTERRSTPNWRSSSQFDVHNEHHLWIETE